ncbi:MAG: DUF302 domain-containing protein [Chitinophagaceae bacterium]
MQANGVIVRESPYRVTESMDMLQEYLIEQGATVYKRIDQQKEVLNAGHKILPLEFILFGNPKAGSKLMAENLLVALDLPQKVIAWEDSDKKVWLAYNSATYLEDRYSLKHNPHSPLDLEIMIMKLFG